MGTSMLKGGGTTVVVVDVQEKLFRVMHEPEVLAANMAKLVRGAHVLGVPVIWIEQLPAKIGPTIAPLAALRAEAGPVIKRCFSCWDAPAFRASLRAGGRRQVLLAGIEAHVCVLQTALHLAAEGYEVFVAADAVSARAPANRDLAFERLRGAGVTLVSVEMALFELLGDAADPRFRELLNLVK